MTAKVERKFSMSLILVDRRRREKEKKKKRKEKKRKRKKRKKKEKRKKRKRKRKEKKTCAHLQRILTICPPIYRFALYSLLSRYVRIATPGPPSAMASSKTLRLQRFRTGDMQPASRWLRRVLEGSPVCQHLLQVAGVLGVSMVMADGVLTPAQSVLGAIQGIRVVRPDLGTPAIVGVTCTILVVLFLVQPFGTARLGTTFAPIVVVWLLFNLATGIYNLAVYDYTVLKAFSPHYAFLYLVRNGTDGWRSLGGLLLAFTGVEALFADLAAFGRRAIQLSWLCLAFPCLMMAYAGQAAYISQDATGAAFVRITFEGVSFSLLFLFFSFSFLFFFECVFDIL